MKHHFTLSERLAILVYRTLARAGLVSEDFEEMVSSKITTITGYWTTADGIRVTNPIERTFTFTTSVRYVSEVGHVHLLLRGYESEFGLKSWRLVGVSLSLNDGSVKRIEIPSSEEEALRGVENAKAELERRKAEQKFFELTMRCPLPAQGE